MKFLLDTSVYLAILLDRPFAERAEPLLRRIAPRMFLSSVVRAELTQGARGEDGRRLVARLARSLEGAGRVVVPTHSDWMEAATAQSKIWDTTARLRGKRLLNDLLIAQGARRIGAHIVTANIGDFEIIRNWISIHFSSMEEFLGSSPDKSRRGR